MKKRLLPIFALAGLFVVMATGASAQQAEGDWAIVGLDEANGSGFQGVSVMRESEGQTEVVIAVRAPEGFFSFLQAGEENLGPAAIVSGDCEEPQSIVQQLGQPMPLQQGDEEEPSLYAVAGSVSMGLDDILTGEYSVGIIEVEDGATATPTLDGTPGTPGATPEIGQQQELSLVACGPLTDDARMGPVTPAPGTPSMPGATPTPGGSPTPTPTLPTPAM